GEGTSERLQIIIEWAGGGTTAGIITRPISRIEHLSYYPLLCERLRTLAQAGYSTMRITESLAQEGFRSPKQGRPLSRQSVHELMRCLGVHQPRSRHCPPLSKHEWWFSDLERVLGVANSTLHRWRKCSWLQARWHPQYQRWVAWADTAELEGLEQRCMASAGPESRQRWLNAHPLSTRQLYSYRRSGLLLES